MNQPDENGGVRPEFEFEVAEDEGSQLPEPGPTEVVDENDGVEQAANQDPILDEDDEEGSE